MAEKRTPQAEARAFYIKGGFNAKPMPIHCESTRDGFTRKVSLTGDPTSMNEDPIWTNNAESTAGKRVVRRLPVKKRVHRMARNFDDESRTLKFSDVFSAFKNVDPCFFDLWTKLDASAATRLTLYTQKRRHQICFYCCPFLKSLFCIIMLQFFMHPLFLFILLLLPGPSVEVMKHRDKTHAQSAETLLSSRALASHNDNDSFSLVQSGLCTQSADLP